LLHQVPRGICHPCLRKTHASLCSEAPRPVLGGRASRCSNPAMVRCTRIVRCASRGTIIVPLFYNAVHSYSDNVMGTLPPPDPAAPARRIAHLDMDAFYASVELLRYPELRGHAVVIGGGSHHQPRTLPDGSREFSRLRNYAGRGVVTTSTYEARALGVFSAMGMMKAAQLAPDAVLLPVDFAAYRHYSRLFKQAVAQIAPVIEDRGIDEIYIDLTLLPEGSQALAQRLKAAVRQATGLTCSIGISPNKLLSKLASELDKPDGITLIGPGDLQRRIWPLAVGKVNGIGPKANARLQALGIETIAQLAQAKPAFLQAHFGLSYA